MKKIRNSLCGRVAAVILLVAFPIWARPKAQAQKTSTPVREEGGRSRTAGSNDEARAARELESVQNNSLKLYAFLYGMPKGSDLHNHLAGAVYAESWIRDAEEGGLCVDTVTDTLVQPQNGNCPAGDVPATRAASDQTLYDALVDAFSMRGFVPTPGVTGHDHFFSTFDKFAAVDSGNTGESVDEVATRAAAQNEQYLELMDTPPFTHAAALARQIGWKDDLGALRNALLAAGLRDEIATDRAEYDKVEAVRNRREHCGQPEAAPACNVQIRYLYQILRGFPKEQVFAQTLLGFEVASVDPRVVGINYVMPEDGESSMADYALHMRIVGFLHTLYPKVHISLHAGELAPGLVTYEGLCCHIRQAVEIAHAERIGHGVDVMYEDRPYDLLGEMAKDHVMVEINLASNDVILGISGKNHPFPVYRAYGVPVALSTDDEGVSRINLTHEYVRAVETYDLHYSDLKQMVRDSIDHAFLPGESLWNKPEDFGHVVSACAKDLLGADKPSARCGDFLKQSEKAQEQWELERRFRAFEASGPKVAAQP
ncbi:MAG: adenosine deaminase family protein [Candidatus Acidiferrales bacterium]